MRLRPPGGSEGPLTSSRPDRSGLSNVFSRGARGEGSSPRGHLSTGSPLRAPLHDALSGHLRSHDERLRREEPREAPTRGSDERSRERLRREAPTRGAARGEGTRGEGTSPRRPQGAASLQPGPRPRQALSRHSLRRASGTRVSGAFARNATRTDRQARPRLPPGTGPWTAPSASPAIRCPWTVSGDTLLLLTPSRAPQRLLTPSPAAGTERLVHVHVSRLSSFVSRFSCLLYSFGAEEWRGPLNTTR